MSSLAPETMMVKFATSEVMQVNLKRNNPNGDRSLTNRSVTFSREAKGRAFAPAMQSTKKPFMPTRHTILKSYAEWTVLSALRVGSPIRSRKNVYGVLETVDFSVVLDNSLGPITPIDFERWHEKTLTTLVKSTSKLADQFGWAAKIVNIYLKTYCYVGDGGRCGIRECLHPPIDSGLWKGINRKYKNNHHILKETHSKTKITEISTHQAYIRIITGLRKISTDMNCALIEVEQLWENH